MSSQVRRPLRRAAAVVAAAAALLMSSGVAQAATISNGGFTNGLTGWTTVSHGSGAWQQVTFVGPSGTLQNGYTIPTDTGQTNAAGTYQSGGGDHVLYQDVTLEPGASHKLSLDYNLGNRAGGYSAPNSLSYTTSPNQQARIDVIKPSASTQTLTASDILATVMTTPVGTPLTVPWTHKTVDLSAFAGQTVRLRLYEVDNQGFFSLGVTNVSMTSTGVNRAPTVTLNGVTSGASYEYGAVPAAACAVTDAEDGSSSVPATLSAVTGPRADAGLGSQTASCAYTDAGGLKATASATYTVVDRTAPGLTVPGDQSTEATRPAGAPVEYAAPTSTDLVDGRVTPHCDHASGDVFPVGATTVSCTATDVAGNSASRSFTVKVLDTTAPVLTLPAAVTAAATGRTTTVSYDAPTAHDVVDGDLAATCDHAAGDAFPLGSTTVTCSATDAAGNRASSAFTVTLQDRDAPVVSVPANLTAEASSADGAAVDFPAATAHDDVDGDLPADCTTGAGSTFPIGSTMVECSAKDGSGNSSSASFTVTVADTTAPRLSVPHPDSTEATGPLGASVGFAAPTAVDTVDGPVEPTCSAAPHDEFPVGTTIVSCHVTDGAGNRTDDSFRVTVADTTAPSVTAPDDLTLEATGPGGAAGNYVGGSAVDVVDGAVPLNCDHAAGLVFPVGRTVVTCAASDAQGNEAGTTFTVKVVDTTAPALSLPANQVAGAENGSGATVAWSSKASATDLVDGDVPVVCDHASGTSYPRGSTTVACSATDAHGNHSDGSFTVRVQDQDPPVVTVGGNVITEATGPKGAIASYGGQSAYDNVDGTLTPACTPISGSQFSLGATTVTCTATDGAGNSGSNGFSVKVVDTTGPVVTVPADLAVAATSSTGARVSFTAPSATDLVDGSVQPRCDRASGTMFAPGTTTVSCSATDAAGNTTTKRFTVAVSYAWSGLQSPVVAGDSYNLGRTIPLKFALTGASAPVSDLIAKVYLAKVSDKVAGPETAAVSTSAADNGNTFRRDGSAYVFNLATKNLTAGTWRVRTDLGDGVRHTVDVVLR